MKGKGPPNVPYSAPVASIGLAPHQLGLSWWCGRTVPESYFRNFTAPSLQALSSPSTPHLP